MPLKVSPPDGSSKVVIGGGGAAAIAGAFLLAYQTLAILDQYLRYYIFSFNSTLKHLIKLVACIIER